MLSSLHSSVEEAPPVLALQQNPLCTYCDNKMGHLHHYIGPHHVKANAELRALHGQAAPSATFYVVSILSFYLFGLALILVHYMNSYYGAWNWSLSDAWLEVKPAFKICFQKGESSSRNQQQQPRSSEDQTGRNTSEDNLRSSEEGSVSEKEEDIQCEEDPTTTQIQRSSSKSLGWVSQSQADSLAISPEPV